jgi:hypothetical protein
LGLGLVLAAHVTPQDFYFNDICLGHSLVIAKLPCCLSRSGIWLHSDQIGADSPGFRIPVEQEGMCMYAAYHLKADELNADLIQNLKEVYRQRKIVILPKDTYEEWEKERHNAAFTEKLQNSIREIEEGKVMVKTMAELRAMENG